MRGPHCRRRSSPLLLAAVALWAGLAADAAAQGNAASDRAALEALYDATGGPGWTDSTNWKTSAPIGEWFGVTTDAAGRVTWLVLSGNGLTGPIPVELGSLTNLEALSLSENALAGPVPAWLGNLTGLWWLNLFGNELTGSIPAELGSLTSLRWLSLGGNALAGPVPAWLGNLTGLQGLSLGGNDLTGPVPVELGSLANLESLNLGSNGLTGPIPGELGSLANLESLDLGSNGLTGPIPGELGSLANLESLNLQFNPLTGSLPQSLTQLSQLMRLDVSHTAACAPADVAFQEWLATIDFRGESCNRPPEPVDTVPPQVLTESGPALGVSMETYFSDPDDDPLTYVAASGHAGTVTALASGDTVWLVPGAAGTATVTVTAGDPGGLSATQTMTVTTAASAGPQSDREVLEVLYDGTGGPGWTNRRNWKTSAPLDQWYGVTTDTAGRVMELRLDDNGLTGPIPSALGDLASLGLLNLGGNELTGPIPGELGSLASLGLLNLGGNGLTGPMPDALGRLANLRWLYLGGNALTGAVPAWLGNLVRLRTLSLWRNDLTGPIPDELGSLANLEHLDLGRNALIGAVPAWLGRLVRLRTLSLWRNDLTGPIPDELGSLANLESLNLSYNWGLSGPLPPSLQLSRLEKLEIFVTQACMPAAAQDWLETIEFSGQVCGSGTDVTIDVAFVHTPAAREAAGGTAMIEAETDLWIAEANQAFKASGVDHRLALVSRSGVAYNETGNSQVDISRLANPSDGHMDEVHALRDRVGADLVYLVVSDSDASRGYIGGPFGLTCLYCGGAVFTHEVGHNMGLWHDRYQVHHNEGGVSPHPAYGYVNQRAVEAGAPRSRRWRTKMANNSQCIDAYTDCLPSGLLRFSNPRQRYNGDPMGIPFGEGSGVTGPADAAAVLNATGPAVALWRARPPGTNRPPAAAGALPDRRLTPQSTLEVDVSPAFVDPDGDALTYAVSSSAPSVVTVSAAGARVTLTAVSVGTATIRVTANDPGGLSATHSFTVTVSTAATGRFTDDPIRPGVTPVRAIHLTELRARIDSLREAAGLGRFRWTDPVLRAGVTRVRLVHLMELRSALAAVYAAAGRSVPPWTDPAPAAGTTPIRAAHLTELRAAVVALE